MNRTLALKHDLVSRARLSLLGVTVGVMGLAAVAVSMNANADSQPPSQVNGLFTTVLSNHAVRISWNRPWDDTGIDGYNVYRNGAYYTTVYDTQYLDNDTSPDSIYRYEITAFDYARNYSAVSAVTEAVTGSAAVAAVDASSRNAAADDGAVAAPSGMRGTEVGQGAVKWEWDSRNGAANYELTVDGVVIGLTRETSFTSYNLWAGEHSASVKSVTGDWQYSTRTPTAKIQVSSWYDPNNAATSELLDDVANTATAAADASTTVASPPAPLDDATSAGTYASGVPGSPRGTEIRQGAVKWEWNAVAGAVQYEVSVDGIAVATVSETSYISENLWAGDHSMTVKSIGPSGEYSSRSNTSKIAVSSNFGSGAAARSYEIQDAPGATSRTGGGGSATPSAAPPPPETQPGFSDPANDNGPIDPNSWSISDVYEKPGYELVFSDEFNSSTLNPARWNTQLRWDGEYNGERYEYRIINGEQQFYVNVYTKDGEHHDRVVPQHNPFELNGSRLAIRAVRNPLKNRDTDRGHGSLSEVVAQQPFLSGAISTYDKFSQKYGYFEARIKIPSHVGTFPAFWLHHQKQKWEGTHRSEIDIMENLGHAPWYVYNSYHYHTNVTASYDGEAHFLKPEPDGQIYTGIDYSQNYHVYAVEWEPGKVTWLIDGEVVSQLWNEHVNYEELYVILNLAIGGHWTNYPANSGGLGRPWNEFYPTQNDINNFSNPALEIDWVRAYRRR